MLHFKRKQEEVYSFIKEKTEEAEERRQRREGTQMVRYTGLDSSDNEEDSGNELEREEAEFEFSRNMSDSEIEDDDNSDYSEESDDIFDSDFSDESEDSTQAENGAGSSKSKVEEYDGEEFSKCLAIFKSGAKINQTCQFSAKVIDFEAGHPIPHCNRHRFHGIKAAKQVPRKDPRSVKTVTETKPRKRVEKSELEIVLEELDQKLERLFRKFEEVE